LKSAALCGTVRLIIGSVKLKKIIAALSLGAFLGSCEFAEAGPFDIFKKIGDSLAHAHDRQVARQKAAKRSSTRTREKEEKPQAEQSDQTASPAVTAAASPGAPTPAPPPVRIASGVAESTGRDIPYGMPVPGKEGFVTSPWAPNQGYVDVRGFPSGTEVKDPYTGKVFRTP
jgi:hypothetical protein